MMKVNIKNLIIVAIASYKKITLEMNEIISFLSDESKNQYNLYSRFIDLKKDRNILEEFISKTIVSLKEMNDDSEYFIDFNSDVSDAINFAGVVGANYIVPDIDDIEETIADVKISRDNAFKRYSTRDTKTEAFTNDCFRLMGMRANELIDYQRLISLGEYENDTSEDSLCNPLSLNENVN